MGANAPGLSAPTISRLKQYREQDYREWNRRDLRADGVYMTNRWPKTDQQRCWVHKTANVLEKLPKAMQPKVKEALHDIWQAETRKEAHKTLDDCIEWFSPKYPSAMDCLAKDKDSMLAFYDHPAENWQHIRTTNPIEFVFATVRLRTAKTKNCGSRITTLTMAFKLMETA